MPSQNTIAGYIVFWLTLTMASAGALARPSSVAGPISANITRVIDGDTVAVEAYIWPEQWVAVHVRLRGVDTPEMHGHCASERRQARIARDFVARKLRRGKAMLTNITIGKYGGRVVANMITLKGENLGQLLVANGLAHTYTGGHKARWCPSVSSRD